MDISIVKHTGEDTGRKLSLSPEVFGIKPNDHAIWLDIKNIQARKRQGTHKAKTRNEIAGSSKKIKKQKGTGTARAGNIKNPLFHGGGRVFGPQPRDYSFKLNKKVKVLARKSALSYKASEKSISVVEDFTFETPKTNLYIGMLEALSFSDKKTLLVIPESDKNIVLSGRNLKRTRVISAMQVNTYDLINADQLILVESSVEKIANTLIAD